MQAYNSANWTDEMLLELIQRQDDRLAFAELYRRYWKPMIDAASQRTGTLQAAEEIVQDVFVSLYIRRKEIRLQSNIKAYLKTALKYQVFKIYRSQQTRFRHTNNIVQKNDIPPLSPDAALENKELREKIYRASEKMPAKCREAFLLSRFGQLSQQEIADKLGISVGTVKNHLAKAMQILREEFQDHQLDLLIIGMFVYNL